MSRATRRAEFANALTLAPDVTGYPYRPATPKAGDAWVLLGPLERAGGDVFVTTWRVRVFLPQDERAASVWADAHLDDIFDVLGPVGYVDRIEPIELPTAGGSGQYALEFTMRSE